MSLDVDEIGMFQAKTQFSELARRVHDTGQGVVVTNRGRAFVRIVPVQDDADERRARHLAAIAEVEAGWADLPDSITSEDVRAAIEQGRR